MRRCLTIALAVTMLFGASISRGAASAWSDLLAAANAEGEVDVHGGPGKLYE